MILQPGAVTGEARTQAKQQLDDIMATLGKPGGFARLNTRQRRFLLAIVLAMIVPADNKVRAVEMERLHQLLRGSLQLSGDEALRGLALADGPAGMAQSVEALARSLPDLLGIEDRCMLISNLWELALCDNELHAFEEKMVYAIADLSEVPRKRVAELMARVAARM